MGKVLDYKDGLIKIDTMSIFMLDDTNVSEEDNKMKFVMKVRGINLKKYLTKKEALAAERALYIEQEKIGNQSLMTLGDLFEDHYNYQKDKVKATTLSNYGKKVKHFDMLKDIKLDDLNIKDIEKWKQEMNKKHLSTRTKNDLMKYLKSALNYGTKWYDFNFTSMYNKMTNFTNPNEMPKEMKFYTYEEFQKFISIEEDIKYRTLFETLYFCV